VEVQSWELRWWIEVEREVALLVVWVRWWVVCWRRDLRLREA